MAMNIDAVTNAPLVADPFDHCVVSGFIDGSALADAMSDFPAMDRPGSFPVDGLDYGPAFAAVLDRLRGPDLARALSAKFSLDLAPYPTMLTVRGLCRARDGRIHTDSKSKIVTVLLYMNPPWENDGGRLRLLRQAKDIEDYVVEVPPDAGTLLAFRCDETAWHGHKPFVGVRRTIQLNWVSGTGFRRRERYRHMVSALSKKLGLVD